MNVTFDNLELEVGFARYGNNRPAIVLKDVGGVYTKATVNCPDENLSPGEICVKDWSENRGMVEALQSAGIVGEVLRRFSSGFVDVPVCRLLVEVPE